MDLLREIVACCLLNDARGPSAARKQRLTHPPQPWRDEKSLYFEGYARNTDQRMSASLTSADDLADVKLHESAAEVVSALFNAEKPGRELDLAVEEIVRKAGGWRERFGLVILDALQKAIREGNPMRNAMGDAYRRAADAAEHIADFAKEHPLYTTVICLVIALGILAILAPSVLQILGFEILGFGQLGPIEGSWAAAWQSTYGGVVESGSLFAYLQKLGMLYK